MNEENPIPANKTFGVLNLGTASSEITFYTPNTIQNPKENYSGTVFGSTYNLYSRSNLCYGIETLRVRYLALVASESKSLQVCNQYY